MAWTLYKYKEDAYKIGRQLERQKYPQDRSIDLFGSEQIHYKQDEGDTTQGSAANPKSLCEVIVHDRFRPLVRVEGVNVAADSMEYS